MLTATTRQPHPIARARGEIAHPDPGFSSSPPGPHAVGADRVSSNIAVGLTMRGPLPRGSHHHHLLRR
jgi:hypothetical protein